MTSMLSDSCTSRRSSCRRARCFEFPAALRALSMDFISQDARPYFRESEIQARLNNNCGVGISYRSRDTRCLNLKSDIVLAPPQLELDKGEEAFAISETFILSLEQRGNGCLIKRVLRIRQHAPE